MQDNKTNSTFSSSLPPSSNITTTPSSSDSHEMSVSGSLIKENQVDVSEQPKTNNTFAEAHFNDSMTVSEGATKELLVPKIATNASYPSIGNFSDQIVSEDSRMNYTDSPSTTSENFIKKESQEKRNGKSKSNLTDDQHLEEGFIEATNISEVTPQSVFGSGMDASGDGSGDFEEITYTTTESSGINITTKGHALSDNVTNNLPPLERSDASNRKGKAGYNFTTGNDSLNNVVYDKTNDSDLNVTQRSGPIITEDANLNITKNFVLNTTKTPSFSQSTDKDLNITEDSVLNSTKTQNSLPIEDKDLNITEDSVLNITKAPNLLPIDDKNLNITEFSVSESTTTLNLLPIDDKDNNITEGSVFESTTTPNSLPIDDKDLNITEDSVLNSTKTPNSLPIYEKNLNITEGSGFNSTTTPNLLPIDDEEINITEGSVAFTQGGVPDDSCIVFLQDTDTLETIYNCISKSPSYHVSRSTWNYLKEAYEKISDLEKEFVKEVVQRILTSDQSKDDLLKEMATKTIKCRDNINPFEEFYQKTRDDLKNVKDDIELLEKVNLNILNFFRDIAAIIKEEKIFLRYCVDDQEPRGVKYNPFIFLFKKHFKEYFDRITEGNVEFFSNSENQKIYKKYLSKEIKEIGGCLDIQNQTPEPINNQTIEGSEPFYGCDLSNNETCYHYPIGQINSTNISEISSNETGSQVSEGTSLSSSIPVILFIWLLFKKMFGW